MWNDVKALLLNDNEIHVILEQNNQTFYEIFVLDDSRDLIHYGSCLHGRKEINPHQPYRILEWHVFSEDTLDMQDVYDVFVDELLRTYPDLDTNYQALTGESYYDRRL